MIDWSKVPSVVVFDTVKRANTLLLCGLINEDQYVAVINSLRDAWHIWRERSGHAPEEIARRAALAALGLPTDAGQAAQK